MIELEGRSPGTGTVGVDPSRAARLVDDADERRRPSGLECAALVATLTPIVVAVVRAGVRGWTPVGDAAYLAVRAHDVLSRHHPWVGAFEGGVSNLGPLHLDLLAPFVRVWPDLGIAIGSASINAASVILVWLVARRLFRPTVAVAVMIGTALLMSTLGLSWLIDPRPQFALVLPFYALLWLLAAMSAGVPWAVPAAVAVGSLCVQTHPTYWYAAGLVTVAGMLGFLYTSRRQGIAADRLRRVGVMSAVVGLLCWAQPLIDQFLGAADLGRSLDARIGDGGAGLGSGVRVIAGPLVPPFWLPGSIDGAEDLAGITAGGAVLVVVEWLAAATLVFWRATIERCARGQVLVVSTVIALGVSTIAAASIPSTPFGLAPQNYYWVWSVGAFATIALGAAAVSLPSVTQRLEGTPAVARRVAPVAAVLVALGLAVWPRYPVASVAAAEAESARVGDPLRDQLRSALQAHVVDRTVAIDLAAGASGRYPFVVIDELQRFGIEFRYSGYSYGLGRTRCADAGRYQRLILLVGHDPELPAGSRVIAEVAGLSESDIAEHDRLGRRFGELLREGVVAVNLDEIDRWPGGDTSEVRDVLSTLGRPADGLAETLANWSRWGWVVVPEPERAAFDGWAELERRIEAELQTVVVAEPAGGVQPGSCRS